MVAQEKHENLEITTDPPTLLQETKEPPCEVVGPVAPQCRTDDFGSRTEGECDALHIADGDLASTVDRQLSLLDRPEIVALGLLNIVVTLGGIGTLTYVFMLMVDSRHDCPLVAEGIVGFVAPFVSLWIAVR